VFKGSNEMPNGSDHEKYRIQAHIIAARNLDHHQRKRLLDSLTKQSHKTQVIESCFDDKKACPHCHSVKLYRYGVVSGLQRHRCRDCQKTFDALTKTPLACLRNKW